MGIEISVSNKRIFIFKGKEYQTLEDFKAAALCDALGDGIDPGGDVSLRTLLEKAGQVIEILRYSGRKPRTPRPEGWVPPAKKTRKAKKVQPEAAQ